MALEKITDGATGEESADIIYNNDVFVLDSIPEKVGETLEKTKGFITRPTPDISDGVAYEAGKYLNPSGGVSNYPDETLAYTTTFIPVEPLTYYTSTFKGFSTSICFYTRFNEFIGSISGDNVNPQGEFITPAECGYLRFNFEVAELAVKQITLSSGIIVNIDPSQIDSARVIAKNLTEGETLILGQYINGSGGISDFPDPTEIGYCATYIPIEPNTDYESTFRALTYNIAFYDEALTFIQTIGKLDNTALGEFTTPANAHFMRFNAFTDDMGVASINLNYGTGAVIIDKLYILKSHVLEEDPTPKPFSMDMRNENTYVGSMNTIITALLAAKPRARFVFISHFTEDWQSKEDTKALIQVQEMLADYWQAPLLNVSKKMQLVRRDGVNNLTAVVPDSLHPGTDSTGETVDRYAVACTDFLKPMFASWAGKRIAWFGTSIPYGYPDPSLFAYPPKVATALGASIINYAVSGSTARKFHADGSAMPSRDGIRFIDLTSAVNYKNSIIDVIGTANDPDIYVFDFGINDYGEDRADFYGLL